MASKKRKSKNKKGLKHYLESAPLISDYKITDNGNLSFHWANWGETCQYQKDFISKGLSNEVKLNNLNDELSELKKTDVWLKNKRGCIKMSLYDVYEGYLDNRLRMTWFERDGILMSFYNEAGPYASLANMKWFDNKIYGTFMFRKLLTRPIPFRGFRVGLSAPILCKFDNSPLNTAEFVIHQATEFGMIVMVKGRNNLSKINNSKVLELEIDVTPFIESKGSDFDSIKQNFESYNFKLGKGENKKTIHLDSRIINKFSNDRNAISGGKESFYFFVPYSDLFNQAHHLELQGVFSSFVESIKEGLSLELKLAA